jgi:hypothetical protein
MNPQLNSAGSAFVADCGCIKGGVTVDRERTGTTVHTACVG